MRAAVGAAETACTRNLPFLPRVAAVLARDYEVSINWGDGDRSYGTVERRADGSFAVRGKHTYAKQGSRKVVVRITDGVGKGLDAKVTSWAIVRR